jgi:hypothetical protein
MRTTATDPVAEVEAVVQSHQAPDLPAIRDLDERQKRLETELSLAASHWDEETAARLESDIAAIDERRREIVAWWRDYGDAVALNGPFLGAVARTHVVTNPVKYRNEA